MTEADTPSEILLLNQNMTIENVQYIGYGHFHNKSLSKAL
jgi:hypothetical protein